MSDKIHNIIDNNFKEQINSLQNIIRLNSVYSESNITDIYPLGENLAICLNNFLNLAESLGFKTKNVDNLVGWAEIGEGDTLYGILAHLDTVPLGDVTQWLTPPLSANIIDGKLYGRGSTDDKGPAVACLYALYALKLSGVKLNQRFRIIVGLDEETKFRCVERYLKTEEIPAFSFSPDALFPAVNGEKGKITFSIKRSFVRLGLEPYRLLGISGGDRLNVVPESARAYFGGNTAKVRLMIEELNNSNISFAYVDDFLEVTAHGKAAHAMNPEKGLNAIQVLMGVLAQIEFAPNEVLRWIKNFNQLMKLETDGKSLGIDCEDPISGCLTINTGFVNYKKTDMIMKFDIRYPISTEPEIIEQAVSEAVKHFGAIYKILDHKPPLYVSEDLKELQILLTAYENITGEKGKPIAIGGGTYCRAFPRAISFGGNFPKSPELAHQINEYADLNEMEKMTHIYAEAVKLLNEK